MKHHKSTFPCGKSRSTTKKDGSREKVTNRRHHRPTADELMGPPVDVWPVTEVKTPEDLLLRCMPAFGAAYIRRIFRILDLAIGKRVPLVVSVAGPVTVSNQHRAWLIPLIEAGWIAYLTTTDAACYHDGHDSLEKFEKRPIREVAIEGRDLEYGEASVIRVTDTGFDEEILFKQDRFVTSVLRLPEFQRKMTGTEFRHRLGCYYAAQEERYGVQPGLLSTCARLDVPIFVGAPGDGSAYLNHVKLWALAQAGVIKHEFELDVAAEVFESCAYHYWGLKHSHVRQLAILILGGGVPKNFSLQPEPTLSQIFLLDGIRGYDFDVQIVGAPVTDGSLTSCKPAEAHTWGKVSREALMHTTESFQTDYSTVMPLIAWALLDKRQRLEDTFYSLPLSERDGFIKHHPEVIGYLAMEGPFRLFRHRKKLMANLMAAIKKPKQVARLKKTWGFPLPTSTPI